MEGVDNPEDVHVFFSLLNLLPYPTSELSYAIPKNRAFSL